MDFIHANAEKLVLGNQGCPLHDIVEILVSDGIEQLLLSTWQDVGKDLRIPASELELLRIRLHLGVSNFSLCLLSVLDAWKKKVGSAATLEAFLTVLDRHCILASDRLREKFNISKEVKKEHFPLGTSFEIRPQNTGPIFVGRTGVLSSIHELFATSETGNVVVVCGLGGIGKTEVCLQYVHRFRSQYQHVLWMNGDSVNSLHDAFFRLARRKLLRTTSTVNGDLKDIKDILREVYSHFATTRSLFVFDNVDTKNSLSMYLPHQYTNPKDRPHVLLTSRITRWTDRFCVLDLFGLTENESTKLVEHSLKLERQTIHHTVKPLIERFGAIDPQGVLRCFPLTLQQALAYIKYKKQQTHGYSILDYVIEFDQCDKRLLNADLFPEESFYSKTTYTTWRTTVKAIADDHFDGKTAIHIFNTLAFMHPDKIPKRYFVGDTENGYPLDVDAANALNLLSSFGMISESRNSNVSTSSSNISVHRLVQSVTRSFLEEQGKHEDSCNFALIMLEKCIRSQEELHHLASTWFYASRYKKLVEIHYKMPTYGFLTPLHLLSDKNYGLTLSGIEGLLVTLKKSSFKSKLTSILNAKDCYDRTPVFLACSSGNTEALKLLIASSAALNVKAHWTMGQSHNKNSVLRESGFTPLHKAAQNGHLQCVRSLITADPSLANSLNGENHTPVVVAARSGQVDIVRELEPENKEQMLLAILKASRTKPEFVEVCKNFVSLLSVEEKNSILQSSKLLANELHACPIDLANYLIKHGAKRDHHYLVEALLHATYTNNISMVKQLVEEGAHPTQHTTDEGWCALHAASQDGKLDVIKYFLKECPVQNIDINVVDFKGDTPLHTAAAHGRLDAVRYLVMSGAKLILYNRTGFSPVEYAAVIGELEIARFLLEHWPVNGTEEIHKNPSTLLGRSGVALLHFAAMFNDLVTIQAIDAKGLKSLIGSGACFTPLHVSVFFNADKLVKYWFQHPTYKHSITNEINVSAIITAVHASVDSDTLNVSRRARWAVGIVFRLRHFIQFCLYLTPASMSLIDTLCNELTGQHLQHLQVARFGSVNSFRFRLTRSIFALDIVQKQVTDLQNYVTNKQNSDLMQLGFTTDSIIGSFIDVKLRNDMDSSLLYIINLVMNNAGLFVLVVLGIVVGITLPLMWL